MFHTAGTYLAFRLSRCVLPCRLSMESYSLRRRVTLLHTYLHIDMKRGSVRVNRLTKEHNAVSLAIKPGHEPDLIPSPAGAQTINKRKQLGQIFLLRTSNFRGATMSHYSSPLNFPLSSLVKTGHVVRSRAGTICH